MTAIYSINNGNKIVYEMGNRKAVQGGQFTEYFVRDSAKSEWRNAYAVFAEAFITKVKLAVTTKEGY